MKKLRYFLVLVVMFTMTSCIDIIEEMSLKKNGSGSYVVTMDMSSLMAEGMKEMLQGMAQEEGGEGALSDLPTELDTIIYFTNAPDSVKAKFAHPEILKKTTLRTEISESKELMRMTFSINFDKVKEIDYFLADLDKMQGDGGAMPNLGGGGLFPGGNTEQGLFKLAKRKLTRTNPPKVDDAAMEDEEMQMMKMFFAEAKYTTIYNLPGKVKKTTIANAEVDGKKITVVTPLMDILEGKAMMGGDISYKRK
jgi:hypothetical protein